MDNGMVKIIPTFAFAGLLFMVSGYDERGMAAMSLIISIGELVAIARCFEFISGSMKQIKSKDYDEEKYMCSKHGGVFFGMCMALDIVLTPIKSGHADFISVWESYGIISKIVCAAAFISCLFCFASSLGQIVKDR